MDHKTIHKGREISKIIFYNLGLFLLLLLSSCNSSKEVTRKNNPIALTSEQQVKNAVIESEKKSDDPNTWPKITKLVVIENYALVRYQYQSSSSSEMLLVQKTNRWAKVFGGDWIALNTMTRMKVPPQTAKKLLEKIKHSVKKSLAG
jgi:hypothetical protein